ncbi:MAG TPA: ROK family transcriptional regulator [Actinomycetes bacterium]|nr:ROK family transcriptional regulator [Actinomycetes bacterium]
MTQRFPAGPQSMLRAINSRAVLEIIAVEGPLTRTELAGRTGLSKPSISAMLAALLDRGAVQEVGQVSGRKGPAAVLYQVAPDCAWSVGIDIGHDRLRVAVADVTGTVRASQTADVRRTRAGLVRQVRNCTAAVLGQVGLGVADVDQVVVGVPGVVGPDGRELSYADALPDDGAGLGEALDAAFPAPVVLENDVNLAALAEHSLGKGVDVDDFVLLSLGVGIGLGVVVHGRLHRGASGAAGEVGYLPHFQPTVRVAAPPLTRDPLEPYVGARAVVALGQEAGLGADLTARQVFDLARAGNEVATGVVEETARALAYVVACVAPVVDPARVVLGGAIGSNGDLLLEPVARHLSELSPFHPALVSSDLGADAVLLGATAMATELARDSAFAALTSTSPTPLLLQES